MTTYISDRCYGFYKGKLLILVGDAASGLVYQRGLNKGWLEAIKCARTLMYTNPDDLREALEEYQKYCHTIYQHKKSKINTKQDTITGINSTMTIMGITSLIGLLVILTR